MLHDCELEIKSINFGMIYFSEEQVFRLKKDNEDLRLYSERLTEGLEKTKAQLDFHMRNGCSIQQQDGSASLDVSQNPIQPTSNILLGCPSNLISDTNKNYHKSESHSLLPL